MYWSERYGSILLRGQRGQSQQRFADGSLCGRRGTGDGFVSIDPAAGKIEAARRELELTMPNEPQGSWIRQTLTFLASEAKRSKDSEEFKDERHEDVHMASQELGVLNVGSSSQGTHAMHPGGVAPRCSGTNAQGPRRLFHCEVARHFRYRRLWRLMVPFRAWRHCKVQREVLCRSFRCWWAAWLVSRPI